MKYHLLIAAILSGQAFAGCPAGYTQFGTAASQYQMCEVGGNPLTAVPQTQNNGLVWVEDVDRGIGFMTAESWDTNGQLYINHPYYGYVPIGWATDASGVVHMEIY